MSSAQISSPRTYLSLVCAAGVVVGCAAPNHAPALGLHTASVTINGNEITPDLTVRCEQTGWLWKISSVQATPGFTAFVRTDDAVHARSVEIRDIAGFTGTYSDATLGEGHASLNGKTFTITGSVVGSYKSSPAATTSAQFGLTTDC